MKPVARVVALLLAVAMIASACSSRDDSADVDASSDTEATEETAAAAEDESEEAMDEEAMEDEEMEEEEAMADEEPAASDVGVSATEINIGVIADIDTPVAPGLSQAIHDAAEAWATNVNANGGIAGRQIVLTKYDSKLNPDEAVNAIIDACQNEFALVGAAMFTLLNPAPLIECADINGDPTGLPDFASLSVSPGQGASPTSFPAFVNGRVFTSDEDEPTFIQSLAGFNYAETLIGDATPKVLVIEPGAPGIRPAAVAISEGLVAARGYETAGVVTYLDSATQAEAVPIINTIREEGVNIVYGISFSVAKVMAEARVQGLDMESVAWLCTAQCFSPFYAQAFGEGSDGLIVGLNTTPWTDLEQPSVAEYMSSVDIEQVSSNGITTYAAGRAFEELMATIVDQHGVNGVTRANVLDLLRSKPEVSAGGLLGPGSVLGENSQCSVSVQLTDGEFVRVDPTDVGGFTCDPSELVTVVNPTE